MKNALNLWMKAACAAAWLAAPAARAVTLDEAVQAALENSPTLQAAESRIDSAQALLRQAKSYYYPSIGASANYARSDNPPQAFMMTLNQRSLNMMDPAFDPNHPDDTDNLYWVVGIDDYTNATLFVGWKLPAMLKLKLVEG